MILKKEIYAGATCFEGIQGGKYYLIDTVPKLAAMHEVLKEQTLIAIDTETSGVSFVFDDACGLSIGWGVEHNFYLPFNHKTDEKQLTPELVKEYLSSTFYDPKVTKVTANGKFDLHFFRKLGLEVRGIIHDTLLISFLLDENGDHGLKELSDKLIHPDCSKWEDMITIWRVDEAKRRKQEWTAKIKKAVEYGTTTPPYLESSSEVKKAAKVRFKEIAIDELKTHLCSKNKKTDISYDYIPVSMMTPYAASDVHYTLLLYKLLITDIANDNDLAELYLKELQLLKVLFDTEFHGAKLDRKYLEELGPKLDNDIEVLKSSIFTAVGREFNINSDPELIQVLEEQGCTLTKLTKGSKEKFDAGDESDLKYSVDKKVLLQLATKYPFAAQINEYNKLVTLKTRYVDGLLELIDKNDYIHCTFNQNVSSGRMSAKQPNLTNIPNGDKRVKRAFWVPSDEFYYVFLDLSQIELRLAAHVSQDPKLLACYPFEGVGTDVHTLALAECILGVSYEEALALKESDPDTFNELRRLAKILNFANLYGAGARGLQEQICTPQRYYTLEKCQQYLDNYFARFKGVKRWIDSRKAFILKHEYTQNIFGRYRRFPGIRKIQPRWKQAGLLRSGVNFEIQGAAADLFKESIITIGQILAEQDYQSRVINFVHDESQFYIHRDELFLVQKIKAAMENFDLTVPIKAEISISSDYWSNKKEIKG